MENKIKILSNQELTFLLNNSKSLREVLNKIGYKKTNGSGSYTTLKNECKKRKISIPKYESQGNIKKQSKMSNEKIFCENSTYSRNHLKNKIIKYKLIEYKCTECGIENIWNNKKISLQLEHKNGINNDNRLENLCFLCPNCHSQTETYAGKTLKKHYYCECGEEKLKNSKKCKKCNNKNKKRKIENRPTIKTLIKDIEEFGYEGTGRKYNVTGNCIKKWIKNYGKNPPRIRKMEEPIARGQQL